jgi:hypothetical protein
MNKILEKLKKIDRRIIYLMVFLSIIIPILPGFDFLIFPVPPTKETKAIFDEVESLNEGDAVFIDWAFDPSSKAELLPMFEAFFKHCMIKKTKVFIYYATMNGINLGKESVKKVTAMKDFNWCKEGVDYINMEYIPINADIRIFSMDVDFKGTYKKEGKIFEGIESLRDIKYIFGLSGSVYHTTFVDMQIRFNYKFGLAVTAVMGPDFVPYLQTGQITGMSNGLRGAAEYERLVSDKYEQNYYGTATKGMSSLTFSHIVIFGFVIMGNIVYFMEKRKRG